MSGAPVPSPSRDEGRTTVSRRLPVSEAYLRSLGRATYAFACLEWSVLQLMERLEPGYILRNENDTAGQIAEEFLAAARKARVPDLQDDALVELALRFRGLVPSRNDLFHAHPVVAENGEERLRRNRNGTSIEWTIAEIEETADAYEVCSAAIRRLPARIPGISPTEQAKASTSAGWTNRGRSQMTCTRTTMRLILASVALLSFITSAATGDLDDERRRVMNALMEARSLIAVKCEDGRVALNTGKAAELAISIDMVESETEIVARASEIMASIDSDTPDDVLCRNALRRYGPNGSVVPDLIFIRLK